MTRNLLLSLSIFGLASTNALAFGFVTPTQLTMTMTGISLIRSDNGKMLQLSSSTFSHTFKKSDTDFAAISLTSVTVPAGRYGGAQVCYSTTRQLQINGETFNGGAVGGFSDGTVIYSVGTTATAANSISTTAPPGGATTMGGFTVGSGSTECSESYFSSPICVTSDSTKCSTGDTIVNAGSTIPNLNLILDLYDSVEVDDSNSTLDTAIAAMPMVTLGAPGAAVHLRGSSGSNYGQVTLLFGGDKTLLSVNGSEVATLSGFCPGGSYVNTTAGPTSNSYGATSVMSYNSTTGVIQYPSGSCPNGGSCNSAGLVVLTPTTNTIGANQAFTVTCVADTTGALGYTYTGGPGSSGSITFNAVKVIDPGNIFGGGCSPSCGSYP